MKLLRMGVIALFSSAIIVACGQPEAVNEAQTATSKPAKTYSNSEAAVVAALESFYKASSEADFLTWVSLFADDAYFYGTDASEAWPISEFSNGVYESFKTGDGWDFEVRERKVTLSPDKKTAWFAEISHFNNTNYTLRPTGVLVQQADGSWKIAQMVMGVPFPNAIYDAFLSGLQATDRGTKFETADVASVLSNLHEYAAKGQFDEYFSLYTENAVFLGSDGTERWTMAQFKDFARPYFKDGSGWTYAMAERNIYLSPMKNVAWFDETLNHAAYGEARGTGSLIRTKSGWKITQYNLTFPVPNDLLDDLVVKIQASE